MRVASYTNCRKKYVASALFLQSGVQTLCASVLRTVTLQIDFGKAYLSGIGIFACVGGEVLGSVFNEFGVSALSFSYNPQKDRVKILSVMGKLNRWYIRRVIKRDMKKVIGVLKEGGSTYTNRKYHITYTFQQLNIETAE